MTNKDDDDDDITNEPAHVLFGECLSTQILVQGTASSVVSLSLLPEETSAVYILALGSKYI